MPTNSRAALPCRTHSDATFAASITLPPPSAITASAPLALIRAAIVSTTSIGGSGGTSANVSAHNGTATCRSKPAPATPGSLTTKTRLQPLVWQSAARD